MVHYHFVLNMAVSQSYHCCTFFEAMHKSRCTGPEDENTTGAQINRLHAYLTSHVEFFEKRPDCKQKTIFEGSCKHIYEGNVAKEGRSTACKVKFKGKREANLLSNKTHVSKFFNPRVCSWIWQTGLRWHLRKKAH
jgi:hypothetical protein